MSPTTVGSERDGAMLATTGGQIDVLLNNAGYYTYGPLEETTPDELRAQMETNFIGVHRVTRAVLPAMRARRQGRVIVIGSVSGLVVLPAVGPYHASKWAIEAWTETLRYEVSAWGIQVALDRTGAVPDRLARQRGEGRRGRRQRFTLCGAGGRVRASGETRSSARNCRRSST